VTVSSSDRERFRDFAALHFDTGKILYEERERELIGEGIAKFKLEGDAARGIVAVAAGAACLVLERDLSRTMLAIMVELAGKRRAIDKRRFAQGVAILKALTGGEMTEAQARGWLKRLIVKAEFRIRRSGLLRRRRWFRRIRVDV
jgi:hypothetical protein